MQVKFFLVGVLLGGFAGCTAAQLEAIDPVTYVDGATCPDANGVRQKVLAGFFCCANAPYYMGPGQCEDGTSCMTPDTCTTRPLPSNVGASKPTKRRGLQ